MEYIEKYIDADSLIHDLEERIYAYSKGYANGDDYRKDAIETLLKDVRNQYSLQQEQPKVDIVAKLKHHLDTTPKEQLEKEWKELEPWNNIGPTVQEFLYGKQPEIDLEKEYKEYVEDDPVFSTLINRNVGLTISKHFYELRLKAK